MKHSNPMARISRLGEAPPMQSPGAMEILLPAAFAGLVAVGVTLSVERWGGRVGGLIGTLPTTIVPASIGIYLQSEEPGAFEAAMVAAPLGMFINAIFLALWRVIPPRLPPLTLTARLALMSACSLTIWLALALGVVLALNALKTSGASLIAIGWGATATMALVGVWACLNAPPAPAGRRRIGPLTVMSRGLLAASAIAAAVWLAAVGGPVAAGVAAVFPAIFLTTMVSLWLSQGEAVQVGAVGPMMLGSTSVALFSVLASWSIPTLGLVAGVAVAWIGAALCATLPAWLWLRRRT